MPHFVIEHSKELSPVVDIDRLMRALHETAAATGIMNAADIKIRARAYTDYLVAGKKDGFCHLSVHLLAGRTPEQKLHLSESLRQKMAELLPDVKSLSVDIRDMDPDAYKKRLNPD